MGLFWKVGVAASGGLDAGWHEAVVDFWGWTYLLNCDWPFFQVLLPSSGALGESDIFSLFSVRAGFSGM